MTYWQIKFQSEIQKRIHIDIKRRLINFCMFADFEYFQETSIEFNSAFSSTIVLIIFPKIIGIISEIIPNTKISRIFREKYTNIKCNKWKIKSN